MTGGLGPCHPDSTISASDSSNLLMNTDLPSRPLQPIHTWFLLQGVKIHSQTSKGSSWYRCHPELLILPNAHFPT